MSQLVGTRCLRCREPISSITEGYFCATCGTPQHHDCQGLAPLLPTGPRCPTCGCELDNEFSDRFRHDRRRRQEQPLQRTASRILWAGVLLHLIAVASAVGAILGAWPFVTQGEHTAGYAIGGVLLVVAALVEVVASALRKRKKWAWTAAIAVFVLGLPGVAAVIGLFLLLNRDVRAEFEPAPTGGAEGPTDSSP